MVSIHEDPENPTTVRANWWIPDRSRRGAADDAGPGTGREALRRLPPPYRSVIHLRYIQQRSYEEIAGILDLPLNTVKARLFGHTG